jgi:hypothetical protein
MFSVDAENSRDAKRGEDLVVTRASHGFSNWLTERGKPEIAVCVPNTASLTVQIPDQAVRGATFEMGKPDHTTLDAIVYIDGDKERIPLNQLPRLTKIRVLKLYSVGQPLPPERPRTATATAAVPQTVATDAEPVLVGTTERRGIFDRLLH